ncbi:MAG: hypothetical protein DRG78_04255 [Epsilonproteobacteria bacterium]|nr:MAG: hypothetical protein DRG78_04255 [Campylobacterota bacterium]
MNKKSKITLYLFSLLALILITQLVYLNSSKSMSADAKEKKILFVGLTGLPDLAFSSNSSYIRHRSLSMVSDIYNLDGCLREYDSATYAIANSKLASKN